MSKKISVLRFYELHNVIKKMSARIRYMRENGFINIMMQPPSRPKITIYSTKFLSLHFKSGL